MRLNQRCGSTSNVQIQIGLMGTAAGIEMSFTSSDTLWSYGRLRPLPSCWVIRMLGLGHPLDGLCVDGGLPCTPVMLGYPGVGPGCPPMAGLPTNPPPPHVTSSGHRPPALPRAPWGSTPPAMRVWGSRPSIASHPRRIPAHTPPATPGFPAHTHCGVDPGTARSINERSEHPSTCKFSLGELHPPCDIRSPHAGPAGPVVPAELRRAWRRCRWCNISYVIPCRHGGMIWPGEVAWLHGMAWYGIVTWCGWMTARHIRS